jgi:hypothetical protein
VLSVEGGAYVAGAEFGAVARDEAACGGVRVLEPARMARRGQ